MGKVEKPTADLAVVVVTCDPKRNLFSLVSSIAEGTMWPAEIVIVANEVSFTISLEMACYGFFKASQTRVSIEHTNTGANVSKARNVGWKATLASLVFFIDDDNTVEPDAIENIVSAFADPNIAAVSPIAYLGSTRKIWFGGASRSDWSGRTYFYDFVPTNVAGSHYFTDDIPNAVCITRSMLETTGGYDELNFPIHREEADLALRIQALGKVTIVCTTSRVRHYTQVMSTLSDEVFRMVNHGGAERLVFWARNRVIFHKKHSHGLHRISTLVIAIPIWLGMVTYSILVDPGYDGRSKFDAIVLIMRGILSGYFWRIQEWPQSL